MQKISETTTPSDAYSAAIHRLQESKELAESLLGDMPTPYCIVSERGLVLKTNKAFLKLAGAREHDAIGKVLLGKDSHAQRVVLERIRVLIETYGNAGQSVEPVDEFEYAFSDGIGVRDIHWTMRLLRRELPQYGRLIFCTVVDVTAHRDAQRQIGLVMGTIPLGLVSLGNRGSIDGPYSKFLEQLLDVTTLKEVDLWELLSTRALIPPAEKMVEVRKRVHALHGLRPEEFYRQSSQLPKVLVFASGGTAKHVKCSYHPQLEAGSVERVIVVLEDETVLVGQKEKLKQAESIAYTDALTGVFNRRAFDEGLDRELRRSKRDGAWLSVALLDVDFFKKFNDSLGHPAGDECLKKIAWAIRLALRRAGDEVYRYGGEEFVVILPNTDESGAEAVGLRICEMIVAEALVHPASAVGPHVTVSVGIMAAKIERFVSPTAVEIIAGADAQLYRAKAEGRNCVRTTIYRAPA